MTCRAIAACEVDFNPERGGMNTLLVEYGMNAAAEPRVLGTVKISAPSTMEALASLHQAMSPPAGKKPSLLKLAFCNAHVVNLAAHDVDFRAALARMTVLPDGMGVDMGSRLLYGAPFPANLNGTDFIPELIRSAPRPLRIALLGGREGVALRAAEALSILDSRHEIIVLGHGYFDQGAEKEILAKLESNPADLLLVAMGNPLQECWIDRHIGPEHARVAAGVGALLDFLAGEVPRAPQILRTFRLEWAYRLWQEPARLWQRYVLGNPAFLLRMAVQKLQGPAR
jgi:exopolysaccharide biosynthesis WecB/TagA/CpsF family protein